MSEPTKCQCGEPTGWTAIKCCNFCGFPHADEKLAWGFSGEVQSLREAFLQQEMSTIRKIITKGGTADDVLKFLDTPNA